MFSNAADWTCGRCQTPCPSYAPACGVCGAGPGAGGDAPPEERPVFRSMYAVEAVPEPYFPHQPHGMGGACYSAPAAPVSSSSAAACSLPPPSTLWYAGEAGLDPVAGVAGKGGAPQQQQQQVALELGSCRTLEAAVARITGAAQAMGARVTPTATGYEMSVMGRLEELQAALRVTNGQLVLSRTLGDASDFALLHDAIAHGLSQSPSAEDMAAAQQWAEAPMPCVRAEGQRMLSMWS